MRRATNVIYGQQNKFDFEWSNFEYLNPNGILVAKGLYLNTLAKVKPNEHGYHFKGMGERRRN